MTIKHFLFYFIICFSFCSAIAQHSIKGKVIDEKTKAGLAFVNIIDNNNNGATTDIDGNFNINSKQPINRLKFSYVGYQPYELDVANQKHIVAKLTSTSYELNEFVLLPGENPAHRIINNVVANRHIHNPEKSLNFKYESYNKLYVTGAVDTAILNHPEKINSLDTSSQKAIDFLEKHHLFLMESVTERKYMQPDKSYEKVLASRVSGLQNNTFSLIATEIQSFSFYEPMLTVMEQSYLNPISVNSVNKYFFLIEDTTFNGSDTVFVISFRPKKGKNFKGLKGLLYINTNGFAVQNVIAEPAQEEEGIGVKIQQQYEKIENSWFPVQLNTTILFKNAQINDFKMLGIGKSYLKNIELNPDLNKKEFGIITTEVADDVTKKEEDFWFKYRGDSLSEKEKATYHIIDSVGKAENFDKKITGLEALMTGKLRWGYVDLDLDRFVKYNDYEGFRLGAGLHTSSKVSKTFSIGGYGAYGTKDKTVKYGGDFNTVISKHNDIEVNFSYQKDVAEPGVTQFVSYTKPLLSSASNRNFYLSRMNDNEKIEARLQFRTLRYLKVYLFANQEKVNVTNDYFYRKKIDDNTTLFVQDFTFSEIGVEFKYAFKQKVIQTLNYKYAKPTKYPILYAKIEQGLNQADGEYEYTRFTFRTEKQFSIKNIGKPKIFIETGITIGDAPIIKLNNSIGTFKPKSFLVATENAFETMLPYEFFSDRFASFHFRHSFGSLLLKIKKFAPEFVVSTSVGFGELSNATNHSGVAFKTMEKGYYESGIAINKILKSNFSTFGVSVHYRYGPYQFEKSIDNFAVKLSLGYSF
jgi:hypothetical protein